MLRKIKIIYKEQRLFVNFILFILLLLSQSFSKETIESISVDYSFKLNCTRSSVINGYDLIMVEDLTCFGKIGCPKLPVKKINILIPYGYSYTGITVTGESEKIRGNYNIEPVQEPIKGRIDYKSLGFIKNNEIYDMETFYPNTSCPEPRLCGLRGYQILTANLYPVQYIPKTGEALFHSNLKVTLSLEKKRSKFTNLYRGLLKDRSVVAQCVDNLEVIKTFPINKTVKEEYELLIVTNQEMEQAFLKLANFKTLTGIKTKVALVEDFISSTPGRDKQEKIRNYIKEEYSNNGITYAILGGDISVLPERDIACYFNQVPSDLYFSGFDGSWDENNNNKFGEWGEKEEDFYAEIYVGRLPVETPLEAESIINKIISFERAPRSNKITLHGAMFDSENSGKDVKEGNSYTNDIGCHDHIPSGFDVKTLYEPDVTPTVAQFIAEWDRGMLLINHTGHGSESSFSINHVGGYFGREDASALTNTVYPILVSNSCLTGRFDDESDDCVGEKLLLNPKGGAVSVVLNSREGIYDAENPIEMSGELDIALYMYLFADSIKTLGNAVQNARQLYEPQAQGSTGYHQVVLEWNLLGDPTLRVFGDPVSIYNSSTNSFTKNRITCVLMGNKLLINGKSKKGDLLKIIDLKGKNCYSQILNENEHSVQFPVMAKGIYLIHILRNNTGLWKSKFVNVGR